MKSLLNDLLYGGDYNPEQWSPKTWDQDLTFFQAANINSITINVFSWALLQPTEEYYDFSTLDQIIKKYAAAGFKIVLATATAAMPAWMFKKYPEVARVDYQGRRHVFGQRHNFCPNSPNYQRLSQKLVEQLAQRYAKNPAIVVWHINNEYGGYCYCQNCQIAFRQWLKDKYQTTERLNRAWNLNFWGHTIYNWDEIVVPNELGDAFGPENTATAVGGLSLDYQRFQSESLLKLFINEKKIIEKSNPRALITTNFHGTPNPALDYHQWAKYQDVIAYDSYPAYDTPAYQTAFLYDLIRGLKNNQPFMLMESTPSQVNWQAYSPLKRPGQLAAQELQAVAHGADTVQYFQLRQSLGSQEKFHGAVISHANTDQTRVFKEVSHLGQDLKKIASKILHAQIKNQIAIVFDWQNWWACQHIAGITQDLDYQKTVLTYYQAFYQQHLPVDVIGVDADFSQYKLIVAPVLHLVTSGLAQKIGDYVANGGHFLTTYFSGLVNKTDQVYAGGYPGPLKKVLGIWVEETDALLPNHDCPIKFTAGPRIKGTLVCDLIHLKKASSLANYAAEFYQGTPAITENHYGQGTSWYVGSQLDTAGISYLIEYLKQHVSALVPLAAAAKELDITVRYHEKQKYFFILNLSNSVQQLPSTFLNGNFKDLLSSKIVTKSALPAWKVLILQQLN
ncbi:beta-galactosidase [Liquorilactobacillus sicerae]|uniref:beta-galactosidase n=1 Tax=Liquorilactobacillus sicerae TaxID=1416943 RepID=UPI002480E47A|nr:beta-galactosidase [Liquorilactobacillus sicerae]